MKVVWLTSILLTATVVSALAANPEWDQATRLYNSGDYRSALSAFRKISEKNPSEPTAHYMLAQCYKNSGNTKQAIAELEWISKSTNDRRVKGPADALLAQLRPSGGAGANQSIIPGAVSPFSIPPGGASPSIRAVGTKAAPPVDYPPAKALVGGTVAGAITAAAQKGWSPCRAGCLSFATSGWGHPEGEQFHAENVYMGYPTPETGQTQYFSQFHIGSLIKDAKEAGPCPKCNGSGWVKSR